MHYNNTLDPIMCPTDAWSCPLKCGSEEWLRKGIMKLHIHSFSTSVWSNLPSLQVRSFFPPICQPQELDPRSETKLVHSFSFISSRNKGQTWFSVTPVHHHVLRWCPPHHLYNPINLQGVCTSVGDGSSVNNSDGDPQERTKSTCTLAKAAYRVRGYLTIGEVADQDRGEQNQALS